MLLLDGGARNGHQLALHGRGRVGFRIAFARLAQILIGVLGKRLGDGLKHIGFNQHVKYALVHVHDVGHLAADDRQRVLLRIIIQHPRVFHAHIVLFLDVLGVVVVFEGLIVDKGLSVVVEVLAVGDDDLVIVLRHRAHNGQREERRENQGKKSAHTHNLP